MKNNLKQNPNKLITSKALLLFAAVIFMSAVSTAKDKNPTEKNPVIRMVKQTVTQLKPTKTLVYSNVRLTKSNILKTTTSGPLMIVIEEADDLPCHPTSEQIESTFGPAIITGGCSSSYTLTSVIEAPVLLVGCEYSVTKNYYVTDSCGNTASASQTLEYSTSTELPVVSNAPLDFKICNTKFEDVVFGNPSFSDNCGGTPPTVSFVTTREAGTGCDSVFTRTWTAYSFCGTESNVSQTITVAYDSIAPIVTISNPRTLQCNPTNEEIDQTFGTLTVTDNCDQNPLVSVVSTITTGNSITRTWQVTDKCSNVSTISQTTTIAASQFTMGSCTHTNFSARNINQAAGNYGGSVSAGAVSNAVGPVSYRWKNVFGQVVGTTATVTNLPAGTYYLTASDRCATVTCNQTIIKLKVSPIIILDANGKVAMQTTNNVSSEFAASPNPFSDKFSLTMNQQNAGKIVASLISQNGSLVKRVEMYVQKGFSAQTLSGLEKLTPGLYLLKIEQEGKVQTLKVIKR